MRRNVSHTVQTDKETTTTDNINRPKWKKYTVDDYTGTDMFSEMRFQVKGN